MVNAARDMKLQGPLQMLLVNPVAGVDTDTPFYREHKLTVPPSSADLLWYIGRTFNGPQYKQEPRLDIVGNAEPEGVAFGNCRQRRTRSACLEGKTLAQKLKAASSEVTHKEYDGVAHESFSMAPLVRDAEKAQTLAARECQVGFAVGSVPGSTGGRTKSAD